jgi:hypothetical protein
MAHMRIAFGIRKGGEGDRERATAEFTAVIDGMAGVPGTLMSGALFFRAGRRALKGGIEGRKSITPR